MTDFLIFLNPLTHLSALGYTNSVDWSQVLERHGSTLRSLAIQEWLADSYNDSSVTPSTTQLHEIRRRCPGLSQLSVNVHMDTEIPHEALDALASIRNLTKLTIRLRGNQMSRDPGWEWQGYGLPEDYALQAEEEGNTEPELPFISPQTVLQIFHHLRSIKQGLELSQVDVYVGNFEGFHSQMHIDWRDRSWASNSKHVCTVLKEDQTRKGEGEAFCHCTGTCEEYKPYYHVPADTCAAIV